MIVQNCQSHLKRGRHFKFPSHFYFFICVCVPKIIWSMHPCIPTYPCSSDPVLEAHFRCLQSQYCFSHTASNFWPQVRVGTSMNPWITNLVEDFFEREWSHRLCFPGKFHLKRVSQDKVVRGTTRLGVMGCKAPIGWVGWAQLKQATWAHPPVGSPPAGGVIWVSLQCFG